MNRRNALRLKIGAVVVGLSSVLGVVGVSMADVNGSGPAAQRLVADGASRDQVFNTIQAANLPGVAGFSVGLDPVAGQIGAFLFAPGQVRAVTAAVAALNLDPVVKVTVLDAEEPQPALDGSGGATISLSQSNCTAGFSVGLGSGQNGFLTAGHCFDGRTNAKQQKAVIGSLPSTGDSFVYGPSDFGIFTIDNSDNNSLPQIVADDGAHSVAGIVNPAVGMPICKHGTTTGTTCGKVTLVDTTVVYAAVKDSNQNIIHPSTQIKGVFQSDACVEPGDSGGPTYTAETTGGTISSGSRIRAVGINSGSALFDGGNGKRVCGDKVGTSSISYHVPISDTSANSTNPFDNVFIKVGS